MSFLLRNPQITAHYEATSENSALPLYGNRCMLVVQSRGNSTQQAYVRKGNLAAKQG